MIRFLTVLFATGFLLTACTDENPPAPQPTNQPGEEGPSDAPDHPTADLP